MVARTVEAETPALDMDRIRSIVGIDVTSAAPLTSPIYDNGTAEEIIVRRLLAYYGDLYPR